MSRAQEQLLELELALDVVALPRMQTFWLSLLTSCLTVSSASAGLDSGLLQTSFWLFISIGIKAPWLLSPMLLVFCSCFLEPGASLLQAALDDAPLPFLLDSTALEHQHRVVSMNQYCGVGLT